MGNGIALLRCEARTWMIVSPSRRYLYKRCGDGHCPDAAVAKDTGKICCHRWQLLADGPVLTTILFSSEAEMHEFIART